MHLLQHPELIANTGQPFGRINELMVGISIMMSGAVVIMATENLREDEGIVATEHTSCFVIDLSADK
jgi:hypothetical protein